MTSARTFSPSTLALAAEHGDAPRLWERQAPELVPTPDTWPDVHAKVSRAIHSSIAPWHDRPRWSRDPAVAAMEAVGYNALVAERDALKAKLAAIVAARGGHPACDVEDADDPISCGWKLAIQGIDRALAS
ncbi:hypothetical protein SEA_MABODAMACA_66 [Microbacterium phage Mabodamaca]|uniref:Uncharacterized protein n=1 Tax=Microbacterium phage Mabodamaca TaxID=3078574 RepID=A0AA96NHI0_9CAUD|nr:hypothetical protein SEA_MABODAMACA_66 [Microbacterium phage Mabodamaca]